MKVHPNDKPDASNAEAWVRNVGLFLFLSVVLARVFDLFGMGLPS